MASGLAQWARPRDEVVRKVCIHCQRFVNAELIHDDEAQAVDKTVRLVLVPLEVVERGPLLVRAGSMDLRQLLRVELLAESGRLGVADLACQRDRFGNDVIGRQEVVGQPEIFERPEDFDDARVVRVSLRDEREQKTGVEKVHTLGRP